MSLAGGYLVPTVTIIIIHDSTWSHRVYDIRFLSRRPKSSLKVSRPLWLIGQKGPRTVTIITIYTRRRDSAKPLFAAVKPYTVMS